MSTRSGREYQGYGRAYGRVTRRRGPTLLPYRPPADWGADGIQQRAATAVRAVARRAVEDVMPALDFPAAPPPPPPPPPPADFANLAGVPLQGGRHPAWNSLDRLRSYGRNTIRAGMLLRGASNVYDLAKDGFSEEKGDIALHDARLKQVRTDRLNDRISQPEAKRRIDDANLRLMGSSVKRLAKRAPGIAANAAFGYTPFEAGVDVVRNAPSLYSTIKSGIQYLGSKMGADPGGLPDSKQFFDYAKQRFTVGTPYGVLSRRVEDDGRKPRLAKCRNGIC